MEFDVKKIYLLKILFSIRRNAWFLLTMLHIKMKRRQWNKTVVSDFP